MGKPASTREASKRTEKARGREGIEVQRKGWMDDGVEATEAVEIGRQKKRWGRDRDE